MVCCFSCVAVFFGFVGIVYLIRFLLEKIKVSGLFGKPVLITGCDSGFGHLLALKCLKNGMPVFAGCLTEDGINTLKEKAVHLSGKLEPFLLDVTNQESVDKAKELVKSKNIGLWGLVNNAGILGVTAPDDWLTVENYQQTLDVNTLGVIRVTHAFKQFVKNRQGRIVTVASVAGRMPFPSASSYVVSKFAVEGYMDVLRLEMFPFKVKVCILEPGFFNTNLVHTDTIANSFKKAWEQTSQEVRDQYGEEFYNGAQRARQELKDKFLNTDVTEVVDCYYHALTAMFPRRRYHPGMDSKFLWIPLSFFPGCLQDAFQVLMMKMSKLPEPAICKK